MSAELVSKRLIVEPLGEATQAQFPVGENCWQSKRVFEKANLAAIPCSMICLRWTKVNGNINEKF